MVKRFHGSRRFIFTGSWSATHVLLSFGFFYEKQAIRRRQFAAIDCDVFMCGSYRIAGSELPRGLAPYSIALETLCIAKCCKLNIKLTCTYFNPVHGFFTSLHYEIDKCIPVLGVSGPIMGSADSTVFSIVI